MSSMIQEEKVSDIWTKAEINVCECETCKEIKKNSKSRLPQKLDNIEAVIVRNTNFFPEEVCSELEKLMFK